MGVRLCSIHFFLISNRWLACNDYKLKLDESHQSQHFLTTRTYFYSEIPLPFPNSSYLLEPSNPMANAEMRFQGYITTLTRSLGYSSPSSHQLGHMTTLFTSLFLLAIYSMDIFGNKKKYCQGFLYYYFFFFFLRS